MIPESISDFWLQQQLAISMQPTAENIAIFLADQIADTCKIDVLRIEICEGYKGSERASWAIFEPNK